MTLKREKDRWGNEDMLSMPRILWQMATFRTEELRTSEVTVGCYVMIMGVLFVVVAAVVIALAVWLSAHLEWVS